MGEGFLLGIDIGGTKSAVLLGNAEGVIFERIAFPTEPSQGPQCTLDRILNSIDRLIQKHKLNYQQIQGIGVSCGGPLDSKKGLILSPPNLPGWDSIPIVEIMEKHTGIKTYLQNDANACAVAEWKYGAGKGCRNMIFLTFGTGLGAGLILNGKLYTGTNDMAGEVGHIRLTEDGPVGYGKAGSFEGYCSGGGIARLAQKTAASQLEKGEKVGFCPSMNDIDSITAKSVGIAAAEGDPLAIEILHQSGKYLGMGLAILIDILNPERIIIGSIYSRMREFLHPYAEKVIRYEALELSYQKCTVLPAGLGEQIGDYACLTVAQGPDIE